MALNVLLQRGFLLGLVAFFAASTMVRSNLVIIGTTVRPNFHRLEGKMAEACPESHPWALANGTRCCDRFHRANNFNKVLDWYDPDSFCFGNNSIPCPHLNLCTTRKEFKEPDHCPSTHPVQMRNACCKTIWRKDEGDCDGGRISDDDDPTCCQEEYLFQTQMCQVHKKRCVALSSSLGIYPCPESHPWAVEFGTRCCERFYRANDSNTDLSWYDSASLCYGGNSIPCPSSYRLCYTKVELTVPDVCPHTHPVQMKNACCKSDWRTNEGTCDGNLIQPFDDPKCCKNEFRYNPPLCANFKRRCVAQVPPVDCSFKDKDYFGHDISHSWFSHSGHTYLDCKRGCQKVENCLFYTYIDLPSSPHYQRCFYKTSDAGGLQDTPGHISGPSFCP